MTAPLTIPRITQHLNFNRSVIANFETVRTQDL